MRKIAPLLLIIVLIIVFTSIGIFKYITKVEYSSLEDSRELADIIISANSTVLSADDKENILTRFSENEGVRVALEDYFNSLEDLKNTEIDLTELLEEYREQNTSYLDTLPDDKPLFTEVDENGVQVEYEPQEVEFIEDSDFLYFRDGKIYCKLGDIDYDDIYFNVTYDGLTYLLPFENFEKSLEARLSDPSYVFTETDYYISDDGSYIDIQYTSIKDPSLAPIIRTLLKRGKIIDFEVTGL